jgi:hypothetical protein
MAGGKPARSEIAAPGEVAASGELQTRQGAPCTGNGSCAACKLRCSTSRNLLLQHCMSNAVGRAGTANVTGISAWREPSTVGPISAGRQAVQRFTLAGAHIDHEIFELKTLH